MSRDHPSLWPTALAILALVVGLPPPARAVEAFDASEEAGIFETSRTWSANVHDLDRDGWEDVLISRHWRNDSRLYLNNQHGGFQEVQAGTFYPDDRHGCPWADVNQDGLPDVFCALGGERGAGEGRPDELWVQQGDGSFVNQAKQYGIDGRYDRGRHATFIDVNHDPYPDLYVGNTFPRSDGRSSRNRLLINDGGTGFRNAPEYDVNHELGGQSVQAVDYDRDGWEDLLVCGKRELRLYRNVHGKRFADKSAETGARGWCEAALLVKVDDDRRPDLVRVAEDGMVVRTWRKGEFGRSVFSRVLRHGQYLATGDVDGDADQDLYILQGGPKDSDAPDERDLMLVNQGNGADFFRMPIPQTRVGRGDSVAAIDYDRNGLSDFIVLNGHSDNRGPIRLVAFR